MIRQIISTVSGKFRRSGRWIGILLAVFVGGVILTLSSRLHRNPEHAASEPGSFSTKVIKFWTCSMHPQIKRPQPGLCPICGMKLVPVYEGVGEDGGEVSLVLNETARRLAEVETTEVRYQEVSHEIRLVGRVEYDETRLSYISAWVPGRLDRLYVDFTGTRVRKGDHLIQIYSPELISAQEEYLQAIKNMRDTQKSELDVMKQTAEATLKSARDKLRLFGITEKQIKEIEQAGRPQEHLTIYSPASGTVIQKNGFEGMYVKTGDRIYTIADLSQVWLFLDAYESDIQWIHYGQPVSVEAEGYPGETFHGKIAFIDPFVNEKTRTIKLRVNVDNHDEKLKPGMFVRALIKATLGEGGRIYEEELAGKWICPMHPDIIKDHQGACDVCGMTLIPTKEFGFAEKPTQRKKALIIPRSAPLVTGKRAVVYVERVDARTGARRYEGREVVLGPRAGEHYIVISGLKEGERVVTKGNFKIDSALQIQAKPSMMNPAGFYSEKDNGIAPAPGATGENAGILADVMPAYFQAVKALVRDDETEAAASLEQFRAKVDDLLKQHKMESVSGGLAEDIRAIRDQLKGSEAGLGSLRKKLAAVSFALKDLFERYEYREDLKIYRAFCPMVFEGQGAFWFQETREITNPYFGTRMSGCGDIQKEYGRKVITGEPKGSFHHHGH